MSDAARFPGRVLPLAVIAGLFALQFVLPAYAHGSMARVLVLAVLAVGYNVAYGFTGLLSLGHAMFFAAGLYGAGMAAQFAGVPWPAALLIGGLAALVLALAVGLIALRTGGVSFMIVTLMFAQAAFLTILYFNEVTGGDEGFVLAPDRQVWSIAGLVVDLADRDARYNAALVLFALGYGLSVALLRSPIGRVLVAIRENEERAGMLGYDTLRYKLLAFGLSGALAGVAGAAYALLFGYVGATFASTQYSILPLLWVLLGGAGTTLGPLVGTALMFVLVDRLSGLTSSYLIAVGVILIVLVVVFPKGIMGTIRDRVFRGAP
ncbi:MAG: branched-chain amino acid ABC transporter permease [Alphaproteobacteria bacterium]